MRTDLCLSDPSSLRSERLPRKAITVLELLTPGGTIYSRHYVVFPLDCMLLLTMAAASMVTEPSYVLIRLSAINLEVNCGVTPTPREKHTTSKVRNLPPTGLQLDGPRIKAIPLLGTKDEAKSNPDSSGMSARQDVQICLEYVEVLGGPDRRLTIETVSPWTFPGLSPQFRRKQKDSEDKSTLQHRHSPRGLPAGDYTSNDHMAQDTLLMLSFAIAGLSWVRHVQIPAAPSRSRLLLQAGVTEPARAWQRDGYYLFVMDVATV